MYKPINDTLIHVSGLMHLDGKTFNLGDDVTLILKGAIVKAAEEDNQDGTRDVTYTFKATEVDVA